MTEPSISVVVPTYQRRASVLRALTALAAQDLSPGEFEVVVSVDGSDDGTAAAVASFDAPYDLRVVEGPRRGRAAACNSALAVAGGDVIVILDDDMEPVPVCLRRHRSHHVPGSKVCVMGAVPVYVGAGTGPAARFMAWKFDLYLSRLAQPGHQFALRDFYSGNTSVLREVLLAAGGFDESFTVYGNEDLELSLRLRAAGVRLVYDAEATALQHYEKDLAGLARDTQEKGTTAVLLARSYGSSFGELQLASYRSHSRAWLSLRAVLLAATRRSGGVASLVLRLARLVERTPIGRRPRFYILLLDYFYWLGAESALADGPTAGPLDQLASDLRRGPVGLLLHR